MRNVVPMLLLALCAGTGLRASAATKEKFMILASPRQGLVQYMKLPAGPLLPLITKGIKTPEGIATEGNILYIADVEDKAIYAVELEVIEDELGSHLIAQRKRTVVTGVAATWLTTGNKLLFTDIAGNAMWAVDDVATGKMKLFMDGTQLAEMSNPGGLVAEKGGSVTYFANTVSGMTAGSIVAAIQDEDGGKFHLQKLASNVDKVSAMCVSQNNIFYTSGPSLYAVKRNGHGAPVEIAGEGGVLSEPRGCAYDGDGTIYVMDRGMRKVFTLPANMAVLTAVDVTALTSKSGDQFEVGENSGILVYEHDMVWQEPDSVAAEGWKDVRRVLTEYWPR